MEIIHTGDSDNVDNYEYDYANSNNKYIEWCLDNDKIPRESEYNCIMLKISKLLIF